MLKEIHVKSKYFIKRENKNYYQISDLPECKNSKQVKNCTIITQKNTVYFLGYLYIFMFIGLI